MLGSEEAEISTGPAEFEVSLGRPQRGVLSHLLGPPEQEAAPQREGTCDCSLPGVWREKR